MCSHNLKVTTQGGVYFPLPPTVVLGISSLFFTRSFSLLHLMPLIKNHLHSITGTARDERHNGLNSPLQHIDYSFGSGFTENN